MKSALSSGQHPHLPSSIPSIRWEDVIASALLLLLIAAFFWRTLSGDVFQPADGGDLASFLYPTYRFAAASLAHGELPLWNPTLYGGAPFIADIQAGFLYLPNVLLFLLNPNFGYEWMQWLAIGHLWWAGMGNYVLCRVLGISRPAAFFAGIAFALSDPLLIHLGNLNLIGVLAWLGWVLAAFHVAMVRRSLAWAALAGLLFAIATYAGHAQSSYYMGLAVAGYWALGIGYWSGDWRLTTQDWRIRRGDGSSSGLREMTSALLASFKYPIVMGVVTLLLTAPLLLPALELLPYTDRVDMPYQENVGYSLAPVPALVGMITPGFFGRGPALHWSLWDRVELPYSGVVALLLALAALFLPLDNKQRRLLPWLGLATFGFFVALGVYTPVHGWMTQLLPGFDSFRAPARTIVLWSLGLAILSGYGIDALRIGWRMGGGDGHLRIHRSSLAYSAFLKWGGLALLVIAIPAMYASLLVLQPDSIWFLRASLAGLAIVLATGAWFGTWALVSSMNRGRMTGGVLAVLLSVLLLLELAATGAYTDISESDPVKGFNHPEIVTFLQEEMVADQPTGEGQILSAYRIDARTDIDDLWQPDTAALVGLRDVWGIVNPLLLRHWDRLWESTGGRHTRLYDMLNVGYVLVRDGTPLADKFVLSYDDPGELSVYSNPDAFPRAWLVRDSVDVPDADAALAALVQPDFDPAQTVILIEGGGGLPEADAQSPTAQSPISLLQSSANTLSLTFTSPDPALLVLSETWYPGWRATVNGVETPVLRANYALRAVVVPAGQVTVELQFLPESWRWGLLLAGVGIGLLCLLFVLTVTRRRSRQSVSERGQESR